MKRLLTSGWVVALSVVLMSCASGMKFTTMNPDLTPMNPDYGRIFFYRVTTLGAALRPNVRLNGETVGEAVAQGFFYVDRPAGAYQVETSTEVTRNVSFTLDKGQTRYIRFGVSMGFFAGHVYGELVENSVGQDEIKDCKYTGKPVPAAGPP